MCCSLRFRRDGVGLCAVDATCRGEGARFCDGSVFYVGISVSRFRSSSRCRCGHASCRESLEHRLVCYATLSFSSARPKTKTPHKISGRVASLQASSTGKCQRRHRERRELQARARPRGRRSKREAQNSPRPARPPQGRPRATDPPPAPRPIQSRSRTTEPPRPRQPLTPKTP